jgi:7-cyano-7-deazaguanine synthase in queuosine biosynthesis
MHDFWRNEKPNERNTNMIMFAKNLALAGAATVLMGVDEPWLASLPVARPSFARRISTAAQRIAA